MKVAGKKTLYYSFYRHVGPFLPNTGGTSAADVLDLPVWIGLLVCGNAECSFLKL